MKNTGSVEMVGRLLVSISQQEWGPPFSATLPRDVQSTCKVKPFKWVEPRCCPTVGQVAQVVRAQALDFSTQHGFADLEFG